MFTDRGGGFPLGYLPRCNGSTPYNFPAGVSIGYLFGRATSSPLLKEIVPPNVWLHRLSSKGRPTSTLLTYLLLALFDGRITSRRPVRRKAKREKERGGEMEIFEKCRLSPTDCKKLVSSRSKIPPQSPQSVYIRRKGVVKKSIVHQTLPARFAETGSSILWFASTVRPFLFLLFTSLPEGGGIYPADAFHRIESSKSLGGSARVDSS